MPPYIMEIVLFKTTRFGDWDTSLSGDVDEDNKCHYLVKAFNTVNHAFIARTFNNEYDVIKFVKSLGEKHE